jgi:hypothetical protein
MLDTLLIALAALLPAAPTARAALPGGGYATEKHTDLGLIFPLPTEYEPVPTQPDERWVVLFYAEEVPSDPRARRAVRPELRFVRIDASQPFDGVLDLEGYLAQAMPAWTLGEGRIASRRSGYIGQTYELARVPERQTERDAVRSGWLWAWQGESETIALIGFCASGDLDDQAEKWTTVARRMRITEPRERSTATIERLYAGGDHSDADFRTQVRASLVRGWRAEDTPNFIVVHDVDDVQLVRRVCRDIELLRTEYARLFPPAKPIESVAIVRICKSQHEYLQYGGRPGTAGYWNPNSQELVLYDTQGSDDPRMRDVSNTMIVLYHEAFHQFIHGSAGRLSPHTWFDEGHGDYFSGAEISGTRMRRIGTNPWRLEQSLALVRDERWLPWAEILHYTQEQYYADGVRCYPQGWAMVYFLRTSRDVSRRREWARILPTYFDALKGFYLDELRLVLEHGDSQDAEAVGAAADRARERALAQAFTGVDLAELEQAWVAFMRELDATTRR